MNGAVFVAKEFSHVPSNLLFAGGCQLTGGHMSRIKALMFDKDGTLFDFYATWGVWARTVLLELAAGDAAVASRLGAAIGYDFAAGQFASGSVVIAGTPREIAAQLVPMLGGITVDALVAEMNQKAATAPQAEAVPLLPFLQDLKTRDLKLGVATNDSEVPAKAHLAKSGVLEIFDFVAGSDSGFGGKPAAGQLLGFCQSVGVEAQNCAMVGDSLHDLHAGAAAGFYRIAVLTGVATHSDLAPYADVVLDSIGDIPAHLDML